MALTRMGIAAALFIALLGTTAPAAAGPADALLSPHAGKVVLVDFWASWCVPCRRSFPWMNAMHERYASDGLVIVAVNVDNDPDAARAFLAEVPARFGVHYDTDHSLARAFEVVAMPSSFLIGRDGRVVDSHLGFKVLQQDDYEAAIRAALDEE